MDPKMIGVAAIDGFTELVLCPVSLSQVDTLCGCRRCCLRKVLPNDIGTGSLANPTGARYSILHWLW